MVSIPRAVAERYGIEPGWKLDWMPGDEPNTLVVRLVPGVEQVHGLFEDSESGLLICAVSVAEFARRLVALGESAGTARERALEYAGLCDSVVPVDTALSARAFELAVKASTRVPLIDALIAAAAHLHDASLVHRNPHFRAIHPLPQIEIA